MKKLLGLIAVISGVISLLSATILACLYLKDIVRHIDGAKHKINVLLGREK